MKLFYIKIIKKQKLLLMTILEKKICLESKYLDKNLRKSILDKAKTCFKNDCSKEYGYILNVNKIVKIKDNYISNVNSDVIFIIDIDVDTLKPEINDILSDKVSMIFSGGLFINIKDRIKVLIPVNSLSGYTFEQSTKRFIKDKNIIKENDIVKVKISGVKYSNKNFSCFGELVD